MALQKRNVVTRHNLRRIVESTDYLTLPGNNTVVLTRSTFTATAVDPPCPPLHMATKHLQDKPAPPSAAHLAAGKITNATTPVPPLSVDCDTEAIIDILGDIATGYLDLDDIAVTDIFLDVGSKMSVKTSGECVQFDKVIEHSDVFTILEQLPGGEPDFSQSNRVIFGQTLHRLAAVTYDGSIKGITIRVGRSVSGLLPIFEGLVEKKNVLLCGSPNVGKTTTLREICKYLSRGKCLCLIDTSGEVCGETGNRSHIVGTSRVFRPVDPAKQYMTLLDCVRNHSPDVIAIDELNTKNEVEVCQTIALRSIQMVASVHGNIQDLVFNPMLNKALGGSTQALVSDRVAKVDGKKVVTQRTSRPIFDVVINITRSPDGLEYSFIEDVADNVSRIMEGKPIHIRRRRMVGDELLESREEVLYPCE
ncbi:hypothetical protein EC957_007847 [Mortierella hygrophila]|uniref:AAA+ ATPase domain-containing protein n=1 Tax=Mortierella hygrophila TaxID=979708 RepID=A0A9P6EY78_9FUNG|nr:hypothetical protein EC957_007847 [Mortierella hygrophila]